MKGRKIDEAFRERILEAISDKPYTGKTYQQIADDFGVSKSMVTHLASKNGFSFRGDYSVENSLRCMTPEWREWFAREWDAAVARLINLAATQE